tara:strand:+ start:2571 stop:3710 length:1140 start_codon:yes stop_codon:yes gene_type:complete
MLRFLKYAAKQLLLKLEWLTILCQPFKPKSGIVLVRLDAIGDFIIWLDTAKEYRRIYPNQKITLVGNLSWSQLASELPFWDEVWPINISDFRRKPFYRWAILLKLRCANFEVAIEPTFSRSTMLGDSCIRASGAAQRIGSIGDACNINLRAKIFSDKWYTQLLQANTKQMMELDRNAEFISHLTNNVFISDLPVLPVMGALSSQLQFKNPYMILFPGASWHGRKWPHQFFYNVGKQLNKQYGWQILICGADLDYQVSQKIAGLSPEVFVNLAGKTTLQELAELIRGAQILISNETSAVHIAAAVGTYSICILGGGHYGRFLPYPEHIKRTKPVVAVKHMLCFKCNWKCDQPHDPAESVPCVKGVTVEQVLDLIPKEKLQ